MTTRAKAAARRSSPRQALLILLACAFFLQSYITQTHIHGAQGVGENPVARLLIALSGDGGDFASASQNDKHPGKDPAEHCLFCQAMNSSGAFVSPAVAALVLPSETIALIPLQSAPLTAEAVSHYWHGRAPPAA